MTTENETTGASRRGLLLGAGQTLSIAGLAAFVGTSPSAFAKDYKGKNKARKGASSGDVAILNAALALEHEGIAAYTLAAGSGLLTPDVLKLGVIFRGHHQGHRDLMADAVRKLGGTPAEAKPDAEYAASLNAGSLMNQTDVLKLALKLERGAANAYLSLIPQLGVDFHQVAARMAGDEAFHVAILAGALGEPVPEAALMFGA